MKRKFLKNKYARHHGVVLLNVTFFASFMMYVKE